MIEQFYFIESVISFHCYLHFWRRSTHLPDADYGSNTHTGSTSSCWIRIVMLDPHRHAGSASSSGYVGECGVVGERGSLLREKVHRLMDIPRIFMALLRMEKDIVSGARVAQVALPDLLILDLNCYKPLNSRKIKHLLRLDLSKTIRTNSL